MSVKTFSNRITTKLVPIISRLIVWTKNQEPYKHEFVFQPYKEE